MPRCRSWRPTRVGLQTPQSSAPGTDRRQWRRCRAKVEPGQVRCAECARALVEHPDVEVRRMVAMEVDVSRQALEVLLCDPDALVAACAAQTAGARDAEGGARVGQD